MSYDLDFLDKSNLLKKKFPNGLSSSENKLRDTKCILSDATKNCKRSCLTSSKYMISKNPDSYVGYANFPNQLYRRSIMKGFEFTLMVVGESGLGKSTLINTIFQSDIYSTLPCSLTHFSKKTLEINESSFDIKENGVNLQLTVVDTPGFGDNIDNTDCWNKIIDYIDEKFEDHLTHETQVDRIYFKDRRVHCCLYFISPTGHGLKPIDIEFMKKLQNKVNIVPIISKADTFTEQELIHFKKMIMHDIQQNNIQIYMFPELYYDDEDMKLDISRMRSKIPFAVIGSNQLVNVNGEMIKARKYSWGTVIVENLDHNDFIALRECLIRTHMYHLISTTDSIHYENFRMKNLSLMSSPDDCSGSPLEALEVEMRNQEAKLQRIREELDHSLESSICLKKDELKKFSEDFEKFCLIEKREIENLKEKIEYQHTFNKTKSDEKKKKKQLFR